ncbi:MAG: hypothetical protein ACI9UU_003724 [Candidatus Azotimanducaceae bacterium]|jgi:uncharacterized protein (DUF342 family)
MARYEFQNFYYDNDALKKRVTEASVGKYQIARGVRSERAIDSKFMRLVDDGIVVHAPTEAERSNVNQYDVHDFVVIDVGTPLMRREAATPGKHTSFAKDMPGVVRDEKDNNLLIAASKGHPTVLTNSARLDGILKLPSANMRAAIRLEAGGHIQAGERVASMAAVVTAKTVFWRTN